MTRRQTSLPSLCLSFGALLAACDAPSAPPVSAGPVAAEPKVEPEDDLDPSDEADEADGADECEPRPAALPRIVFVLDRSSSMDAGGGLESGEPHGVGERSRWALLHATVARAAEVLAGQAQLGAVLFPSSFADINRDAACDVLTVPDVPVGPYTARGLLKRLPRADAGGFLGGSPVAAAYTTALEHLENADDGTPAAIVLVTDGGANCVDDADLGGAADHDLVDLVAFARNSRGVHTFVVGVDVVDATIERPAINPDESLREIARAGGVARAGAGYFSAHDPAPLAEALADFAASAQGPTPQTCP